MNISKHLEINWSGNPDLNSIRDPCFKLHRAVSELSNTCPAFSNLKMVQGKLKIRNLWNLQTQTKINSVFIIFLSLLSLSQVSWATSKRCAGIFKQYFIPLISIVSYICYSKNRTSFISDNKWFTFTFKKDLSVKLRTSHKWSHPKPA